MYKQNLHWALKSVTIIHIGLFGSPGLRVCGSLEPTLRASAGPGVYETSRFSWELGACNFSAFQVLPTAAAGRFGTNSEHHHRRVPDRLCQVERRNTGLLERLQ